MVRRYIPKGYTKDTFVNFQAKLGIGTDNIASGGTYGFNPVSRNRLLMEWTYRGSWICGVGVDSVADDMTSDGIEISSTMKPKDIEKIQAAFRRKQVWQSLNQVAKWARLYGGALGYIVIKDQKSYTPLRLETIKPGQFQGISVLDRWMVNPDLTRSVMQPGPDFGMPEFYDVVATSFQFPIPREKIHYSRLVRMEGVELPFNQKVAENMWGISVLERLWDRLLAYDSTTQGAAQLAYKAYLRTIKVEGLRKIIATGGKTYDALVAQIEMIRRYQANEGITLLDSKDDFEAISYTFAGLDALLEKMGDQVSGALEVPQTRLFGQAPGGLNSDGESGLQNYENKIKRTQERWFRRPVDVILRVVAANEDIEIPEGTEYEFNSIRKLTELQKSEVNANDTTAVVQAGSLPGMNQSTLMKELRQAGKRTGYWSNITDKDIKDAEEVDALPSPQEMMLEMGGPAGPGQPGAAKPGQKPGASAKAPYPLKKGEKEGSTKDTASIYDVSGIPVYIENLMGTIRKGGRFPFAWKVVMPADYGYIEGVGSAEGAFEQLDCFVGKALDSKRIWVIDQLDRQTGAFDEHKCMLGFANQAEALDIYRKAYHDGKAAERIGGITEFRLDEFKDWIASGRTDMPLSQAA